MNNKLGKKLAMASLCACLAATSLTGCGAKEEETVITVDDSKASYGLVNLMLRYNQAQMQSFYGAFMGEDMWTTYGETAKESVVENLEELMLLEDHMEEYQVSLSDEEKTKIADVAKAFVDSNDEKVTKAMSATTQNVERMLTLYTIQTKMYDAIIADVDTNVTDEEAAQKTVQYVLFSTAGSTDEEGNTVDMTDEEKAAKKSQAEQLLEAVKGGQDMAEALKEIDENRSPVTSSYGTDNGTLSDTLKEASEKLSDGEVADLIETDGGYYVLQMVTTFDKEKTESQKETILSQRKSDKYTEVTNGWKESAAISTDSDLLSELTFEDTFEMKQDETESETGTTEEAVTEAQSETAGETAADTQAETAEETTADTETEEETPAESQSET